MYSVLPPFRTGGEEGTYLYSSGMVEKFFSYIPPPAHPPPPPPITDPLVWLRTRQCCGSGFLQIQGQKAPDTESGSAIKYFNTKTCHEALGNMIRVVFFRIWIFPIPDPDIGPRSQKSTVSRIRIRNTETWRYLLVLPVPRAPQVSPRQSIFIFSTFLAKACIFPQSRALSRGF
jgi:hypothetical protein